MIAIMNSLPVNQGAADEGAADGVVERFSGSRGHVRDFPGFVSMEALRSTDEDGVLVVARRRDRAAFDAWVGREELRTPSAPAAPRRTGTTVR
jgi:heme-degrading monooxygenase HmoA